MQYNMNSTKNGAALPTNGANLGEDNANLNLPTSFAPSQAHTTPPHSLEAEQSTLGAMLLDNAVIPAVIERLKSDDFYFGLHRTLLAGIVALYSHNTPVDLVTLCDWLRRKDKIEDVGGAEYISALMSACPSSANFAAYVNIVADLALKRQAALLSVRATNAAMNGVTGPDALAELRLSLEALEARTAPQRVTHFTAAQLLQMELPEPNWVVPELLTEGFTILAGNPKLGKSWLALGLAIATATGGAVLSSVKANAGDVLYLALEDTPRRLQQRLRQILSIPGDGGGFINPDLSRLDLHTEWPTLERGGLSKMERWLQEHPDATLVVVDTFQKIRGGGGASNSNAYGADYEAVAGLKALADRYGVALVAVHHRKKGEGMDDLESISGSYGLTGAADGIWSLKRERGRADATLFITGRDVNEQELALRWNTDTGTWSLMGEAGEYRMGQERAEIIDTIRTAGRALSPKEMHEEMGVGKNYPTVKQAMWQMSKDGQLCNNGGKYSLVTQKEEAKTSIPIPLSLPIVGDSITDINNETVTKGSSQPSGAPTAMPLLNGSDHDQRETPVVTPVTRESSALFN